MYLASFIAIVLFIAASAAFAAPTTRSLCTSFRERMEIHDLIQDPEKVRRLNNAFRVLHQTPAPSTTPAMSLFEKFAWDHNLFAHHIHQTPIFLPFHRVVIYELETMLRKIDPEITIPYFNSSYFATTPHLDPVYSPVNFGDVPTGECVNGDCCIGTIGVNASTSASWMMQSQSQCTRRGIVYGQPNRKGSAFLWAQIDNQLLKNPKMTTFREFSPALEYIHGTGHYIVGGTMFTMFSPMDPLFYFHHAFIDAIWNQWQTKNDATKSAYEGKFPDGRNADLNADIIHPYNVPVRDVLDLEASCVRYLPAKLDEIIAKPVTSTVILSTSTSTPMSTSMSTSTPAPVTTSDAPVTSSSSLLPETSSTLITSSSDSSLPAPSSSESLPTSSVSSSDSSSAAPSSSSSSSESTTLTPTPVPTTTEVNPLDAIFSSLSVSMESQSAASTPSSTPIADITQAFNETIIPPPIHIENITVPEKLPESWLSMNGGNLTKAQELHEMFVKGTEEIKTNAMQAAARGEDFIPGVGRVFTQGNDHLIYHLSGSSGSLARQFVYIFPAILVYYIL